MTRSGKRDEPTRPQPEPASNPFSSLAKDAETILRKYGAANRHSELEARIREYDEVLAALDLQIDRETMHLTIAKTDHALRKLSEFSMRAHKDLWLLVREQGTQTGGALRRFATLLDSYAREQRFYEGKVREYDQVIQKLEGKPSLAEAHKQAVELRQFATEQVEWHRSRRPIHDVGLATIRLSFVSYWKCFRTWGTHAWAVALSHLSWRVLWWGVDAIWGLGLVYWSLLRYRMGDALPRVVLTWLGLFLAWKLFELVPKRAFAELYAQLRHRGACALAVRVYQADVIAAVLRLTSEEIGKKAAQDATPGSTGP